VGVAVRTEHEGGSVSWLWFYCVLVVAALLAFGWEFYTFEPHYSWALCCIVFLGR
jgi:hypothetical protein